MQRFFVPSHLIQDTTASLPPEAARQAALVLRLKPGERVILLDNLGSEYLLELETVNAKTAGGRVLEKRPCTAEPASRIWLYQSLTSREKIEWILQKGTELGMAGITPVISERCLVRADEVGKAARRERILQEAAEQCGRGHIPALEPAMNLPDALQAACKVNQACLFAWEQAPSESGAGLAAAAAGFNSPASLAIFIGPEGGFTDQEVELARAAGARLVSLGRRILRTETAALASLAVIMSGLGELG